MEHASLDTALELTPISRDEIAQKKTSMPREDLRPMFDKLVAHAAEKKASDIFINTENYISIKTDGQLNYTKKYMEEGDVYNLIEVISRPEAFREFLRTHELNMMVEVPDVTYLRVNVYLQKNVPGLVLRLIPAMIPKLDDLELPVPDILKKISMVKRGLVIVIGATGNGKSTTLASMIDHRNENSSNHIITVEDPIEFVHKPKKSVVIQREVGIDTASYGTALKTHCDRRRTSSSSGKSGMWIPCNTRCTSPKPVTCVSPPCTPPTPCRRWSGYTTSSRANSGTKSSRNLPKTCTASSPSASCRAPTAPAG